MDRYKATLDYLFNRLPMFQRTGPAAYKHSLGNTLLLDALYHSPHRHYPSIHIAGTNGKGSVSHMLAAIFQSAGYRTGLYTSPHLIDFRERIRINGKMIPKTFVVRWVADFLKRNGAARIAPSFFELTAAMAFDYFAAEKTGIAIIETGLGGRLDSTNIITPEVSIITNISFDHTSLLGNTLQEIAREKAGIIKPGIPVVVSQYQPEVSDIFLQKAAEKKAPVWFASGEFSSLPPETDANGKRVFNFIQNGKQTFPELKTDLTGLYQQMNIPAVLKAVEIMTAKGWKISKNDIYKGLADVTGLTGLQGRWQKIGSNPSVICDTGHNEDGLRQVAAQLRHTEFEHLHFVFGVVSDKDISHMLPLLPLQATYYFTKASIPRALDQEILREKAAASGLHGNAYATVGEAFEAARNSASANDLIFVGGSNFVVAEVLEYLSRKNPNHS